MTNLKKIIKNNKYSIYTFCLCLVIGILIFSLQNRLIGGKYTFIHCDMLNQMIPFIKMFYRQLFIKGNIFYSFDFTLGSSTIPQYAFYSCFNPFNIILLLPIDINISSFIFVMAKISTGALVFHKMCHRITRENSVIHIAMSLSYAFSGFVVAYYHVIIWLDGIYFLPLIIILIYNLVEKNKCVWLIFAYSSIFIINFYAGYVVGIYTFIFFILYLFILCECSKKDKLKILIKYVTYVAVSVMISAVILLPTAVNIIKYAPEDALGFGETIVSVFDLLKQFYIGQSVDETGYYPYVYSGIVSFMICPVFFLSHKIRKRKKIFFGLILLVLVFFSTNKLGYQFIHAFNNPDAFGHRYAYLYSFTVLIMCVHLMPNLELTHKSMFLIIGFLMSGFIIVYSIIQKGPDYITNPANNSIIIVINVVYIFLYSVLLIIALNKKHFNLIFSLIIISELIVNGYIYKDMYSVPFYEFKSVFDYCLEEESRSFNGMKRNNDIFRVYMPNALIFNNPQYMGYSSIDVFSSILNRQLNLTMRSLGYMSNYLAMSENGSTPLMRMLLGQNYYIYCNDLSDVLNELEPSVNKASALPIAYMSSDKIVTVSFEGRMNPFENQNLLLSALCGEDIDYYYNTGENVDVETSNIIISNSVFKEKDVAGFEIENDQYKDGYILFIDETNESSYAYFEMVDSYAYTDSPYIDNNLETYLLSFKPYRLSEPAIVEMKKSGSGSYIYIIMDETTASNYYFKEAYFYGTDDKELEKACDYLYTGAMDVVKFEDGYVCGNVIANDEKDTLFTTIPYEEGWEVYIDGEKGEIISLVDSTFIGAKIPYGFHKVEFKFADKWAQKGGIVTLIGLLLSGLIFYNELKMKTNCGFVKDKEEFE